MDSASSLSAVVAPVSQASQQPLIADISVSHDPNMSFGDIEVRLKLGDRTIKAVGARWPLLSSGIMTTLYTQAFGLISSADMLLSDNERSLSSWLVEGGLVNNMLTGLELVASMDSEIFGQLGSPLHQLLDTFEFRLNAYCQSFLGQDEYSTACTDLIEAIISLANMACRIRHRLLLRYGSTMIAS